MKILLLGSGGREHAIGRALSVDPAVTELHAAPGNPGLAGIATLHAADPAQALGEWLQFWSPGNHDDRTLALFIPGKSA